MLQPLDHWIYKQLVNLKLQPPEEGQHSAATMRFQLLSLLPLVGQALAILQPNYTTSAGVSVYNPGNFFTPTGPWSLMSHAGESLYIAGSCLSAANF